MPTSLSRPLEADQDRYQLLEDVELKELSELYLLLSYAKGLEDELKSALGPDRWRTFDHGFTRDVKTVQSLDYQSRKDVFIRSTLAMADTRDYEIDDLRKKDDGRSDS